MREVILSMHISLDGFIAGPNGELDWATMSPEMDNNLMPAMMAQADTCLIGRVLYEGFASYWPDAPANNPKLSQGEVDFARWIEQAQKVVFSTTLEQAEWHNSRLVRGDLAGEVQRLKQQPGKDMILFGGVRIAQEFVRLGLVDVFDLALNPVILGEGQPLFTDPSARQDLALLTCQALEGKAVALRYARATNEPAGA